ncbi:unnamed protein product [Kuraishia capsulata CBS 1993]|uniref:Transcription regulator Rua1 C-terminal domain-containing protein n=1 Tax=Kuraishia capsulata CBS 1993 TaxID=1382522 RepID=W6MSL4_9ASCO|nr:uncharacterized protein KUCA_T00005361001 [Kuraishia capsulata CBS 1993]CDK29373.1 unnamed protein product [Kuraishia capsulata CBS 1993]
MVLEEEQQVLGIHLGEHEAPGILEDNWLIMGNSSRDPRHQTELVDSYFEVMLRENWEEDSFSGGLAGIGAREDLANAMYIFGDDVIESLIRLEDVSDENITPPDHHGEGNSAEGQAVKQDTGQDGHQDGQEDPHQDDPHQDLDYRHANCSDVVDISSKKNPQRVVRIITPTTATFPEMDSLAYDPIFRPELPMFKVTIKEDMSCLKGDHLEKMRTLREVQRIIGRNGREFLTEIRLTFADQYASFFEHVSLQDLCQPEVYSNNPNPHITKFIDAFYGKIFGCSPDVYFKPIDSYPPEKNAFLIRRMVLFLPLEDHRHHVCGLECVQQTESAKILIRKDDNPPQPYVINVFPPLLYFQVPNHITLPDSLRDESYLYLPYVPPSREVTAYTPKVVRRSCNQDLASRIGNEALCPICTKPGYYSMNGSNYFHHMKTQHGIFSKGEIMLQPLYYGKHPSRKTKRSGFDESRNMGICPLCFLEFPNNPMSYLFEINPWAGKGNNPYLNYLRHCEKKHQMKIRRASRR